MEARGEACLQGRHAGAIGDRALSTIRRCPVLLSARPPKNKSLLAGPSPLAARSSWSVAEGRFTARSCLAFGRNHPVSE